MPLVRRSVTEIAGFWKLCLSRPMLLCTCGAPFLHIDRWPMTCVVGDAACWPVVGFRFSPCAQGLFWKVTDFPRNHIRKEPEKEEISPGGEGHVGGVPHGRHQRAWNPGKSAFVHMESSFP